MNITMETLEQKVQLRLVDLINMLASVQQAMCVTQKIDSSKELATIGALQAIDVLEGENLLTFIEEKANDN